MTNKEFSDRLWRIFAETKEVVNISDLEPVNTWFGQKFNSCFQYGATSMACQEKQLADLKGCERKTTFMSDLSVAEWCSMATGDDMTEFFRNFADICNVWKMNEVYMSEFILCVNWKAWEHDARGNSNWAAFYSQLFYGIQSLMYDLYEGDEKRVSYMWDYLD